MNKPDVAAIDLQSTLQQWADMVISDFFQKADDLKIHRGKLLNSFKSHVYWHSGGDLDKVAFMFEYYGRFVDMGVGRGVNMASRKASIDYGATERRAKPWFSSTFYKNVAKLRREIEEQLGNGLPLIIARNLEDNADLGHTPLNI